MMMPKKLNMQDARRAAESRFSKATQAEKKALKERDKARLAAEAHTARLRALRLAKEAADREAAEQAAAEKAVSKTKRPAKARNAKATPPD